MKCEVCGRGPMDGVTVYRTGEKGAGKDPHWRCLSDIPQEKQPDSEVLTLAAIIESDGVSKQ